MHKIAVFTAYPALDTRAQALALALNIERTLTPTDAAYCLMLTPEHLSLKNMQDNSLPLLIDFTHPSITYRRKLASLKKEKLARALGLKHGASPSIIDATAGLGLDSFILASLGFKVTLCERSPIIHALLTDGLARARAHPDLAPIVHRLELQLCDASQWLQDTSAELVYLDPMFPTKSKSALAKKEMRMFSDIVGLDEDADLLLQRSLACATHRVVVKRPLAASYLAEKTPSFSQSGRSCRFDIYLK